MFQYVSHHSADKDGDGCVQLWINIIGVGRGGGATYPLPPPNPPIFSLNFYVKQEKITNVRS